MAETETEIVEGAEGNPGGHETQETAEQRADRLEKELADARKREDEERGRREAAEAERDANRRNASTARNQALENQKNAVTTALQLAESEADEAGTEYASAMEEGRFADAAKAQRKIVRAENKIAALDYQKRQIEDFEKRAVEVDKAGWVVDITNWTAPSKEWMLAHKEFLTDSKKLPKLYKAHWAAVADGHVADTPEYFAFIERDLDLRSDEGGERTVETDTTSGGGKGSLSAAAEEQGDEGHQPEPAKAAPTKTQQRQVASAPPGRVGGQPQNGKVNTLPELSKDEREMAEMTYPNLSKADAWKKYATDKKALVAEGRLQPKH